jgi:acetyltransferase-like isoleucine patch superfamily enzyme
MVNRKPDDYSAAADEGPHLSWELVRRKTTETLVAFHFKLDALCNPYPNLRIGSRSQVGIGCHFSLNAPVTIGDNVVFGHYIRILTDTHTIGPSGRRCGERIPLAVTIEDGVWVASDVTILPGVTIGAGSVVASGAVVTKSVPRNSLVGGVPAEVLREFPEGAPARTRELALAEEEAKADVYARRSMRWK